MSHMALHRTGRYRGGVTEVRIPAPPAVDQGLGPAPAIAASIAKGPRADAAAVARVRLTAGAVLLFTGALLLVSAWLEPAPVGLGTHTALGLPRCGWITAADMPCPTCGMTTAFAHAADGRFIAAFLTQPMGALLALLVAMTFVASLHAVITGQTILPLLRPLTQRLLQPAGWAAMAAIVLASWGWKILTHRGYI